MPTERSALKAELIELAESGLESARSCCKGQSRVRSNPIDCQGSLTQVPVQPSSQVSTGLAQSVSPSRQGLRRFSGLQFSYVGRIQPERNANGEILEEVPHTRYRGSNKTSTESIREGSFLPVSHRPRPTMATRRRVRRRPR